MLYSLATYEISKNHKLKTFYQTMTTMSMKRSREDDREVEALAMANCLMLLNQIDKARSSMLPTGRVFECKTCNRQFPSFQALGGHRASHKRPKLMAGDLLHHVAVKPKKHECSICGVEFALGQALGGHMRRHRAALSDHGMEKSTTADGDNDRNLEKAVPFLKRSNSSKRVWGLDLNLMPPYEIDLKLGW